MLNELIYDALELRKGEIAQFNIPSPEIVFQTQDDFFTCVALEIFYYSTHLCLALLSYIDQDLPQLEQLLCSIVLPKGWALFIDVGFLFIGREINKSGDLGENTLENWLLEHMHKLFVSLYVGLVSNSFKMKVFYAKSPFNCAD